MSRKTIEQTATFTARSANGKAYTIHERTEFIDANTRDGADRLAGQKSYRTADGETVNYVSKGKYRTLSGVDLVSDDRGAP
jgi:hypothetical protein